MGYFFGSGSVHDKNIIDRSSNEQQKIHSNMVQSSALINLIAFLWPFYTIYQGTHWIKWFVIPLYFITASFMINFCNKSRLAIIASPNEALGKYVLIHFRMARHSFYLWIFFIMLTYGVSIGQYYL